MKRLGIYFGPKVISIVETKGKSILNDLQISTATIGGAEGEEKVSAEVKIIAVFKEMFRKKNIQAKEATFCLAGKDLIIRTFEMPLLPKEELGRAVNFEVKKYIPFKVEDLITDFQVKFDRRIHANLVLFMGIKKEALDKYFSIAKQLNIKINTVEYSGFSILRCLKVSGASDKGVVGTIGIDLQELDEINFTVSENGFPLFSRDISLTRESSQETLATDISATSSALDKLKTEIRVSLDYYNRKFSSKKIQKVFLIVNQEHRSELEAFMKELALPVQVIDVAKVMAKPVPYSLSFIKGYSASLSKVIKLPLKLNLLGVADRFLKEKAEKPGEEISLLEGLNLDFRAVVLGLLILIAVYGLGLYRKQISQAKIKEIVGIRPKVAIVSPQMPYADLTNKETEFKTKLNNLDKLIKKQLYVTKPLDIIPRAIPEGVWLKKFSFNNDPIQGKSELTLGGVAYLGDSNKEFKAINTFLSNLNDAPDFVEYFKDISIASLESREEGKITVTNFVILCRASQQRK